VIALTTEAKGLDMCVFNAEVLVRSQDGEIARLRLTLAVAKKEKEEVAVNEEMIQQKSFDNVYNAYEASINHYLRKVLHLCDVSDPGVFDINKDIYHGELMLIDEIMEDTRPRTFMLKVFVSFFFVIIVASLQLIINEVSI